jgi:hypothetical protein
MAKLACSVRIAAQFLLAAVGGFFVAYPQRVDDLGVLGEELDAEGERQRRGLEAGEEEHEHEVQRDGLRQERLLPPEFLDHVIEEVLAPPLRIRHPLLHHAPQHLHRVLPTLLFVHPTAQTD